MASVYILHSKSEDKFYVGSCKDLKVRLDQHRSKVFTNSFTAKSDNWELFLSIDELEYTQARQIETHIKRMKSKIYIENLIRYPEMVEKLRVKYAGSSR